MIPLRTLYNDILLAGGTTILLGVGGLFGHSLLPVAPTITTDLPPLQSGRTFIATAIEPTIDDVVPDIVMATTTQVDALPSVQTSSHSHTTVQPAAPTVTRVIPVTPSTSITNPVASVSFQNQVAAEIEKQTTSLRRTNNLSTLQKDAALTKNATAYSQSLLRSGELSHTDTIGCDMSCRFIRDDYKAASWGENLAVLHFKERPTPDYVATYFMKAWEKSPGHNANLLSPIYTKTGIGVAIGDHDIYVTVQFAKPN
jgi:uncharacterized protein YkwD